MRTSTALAILGLALAWASTAAAVPSYSIVPLGFDDLEHTRDDGYKYSIPEQLNEAGQVTGYSSRYNGGTNFLGYSAWLYDGVTTINVGLTGPEYTHNNGYKETELDELNEAGQVTGYSVRYNGGNGTSAWIYDGATTIDIGLTGPEHTRENGSKESYVSQLNEAGQVRGHSERYNGGSTFMGETAWLYDGATTIELGLIGPAYTRSDGYKFSRASYLNEAGQVIGYSGRYNGSTNLGSSAWLHDAETTIELGLTGLEHTRNDGYRNSQAEFGLLNEAGQVAGISARFDGDTDFGQSAWLYDGMTTINIGLTSAEHTRNDGYKYSLPLRMNEAGQVAGDSNRYNGSADFGQSAWLYDGATTIELGLTGPEHTRNDGRRFSSSPELNEAGQVAGNSARYNGGAYWGSSAWLYDGVTTIDIGLTGSEYTRSDGYKFSYTRGLNNAGQVWGTSDRYNGGSTYLGDDPWLYDPVLDQTFSLHLSTRSDGYAGSSIRYLGEDGLVVGTYDLYDSLDNYLGSRIFYFTVADGLHDLGPLVDGGLAANGWEHLATALGANSLGQIIGTGARTGGGDGSVTYLLTPLSGLEGDYNNDGVVDAGDYVRWRNALAGIGTISNETASLGIVDGADYDFWKAHFGDTAGSGVLSDATVPEPSVLCFAVLGAIGLFARRRKYLPVSLRV